MAYRIAVTLREYTQWKRGDEVCYLCFYTDFKREYLAIEGTEDILPRFLSAYPEKGQLRAYTQKFNNLSADTADSLRSLGWVEVSHKNNHSHDDPTKPVKELYFSSYKLQDEIIKQVFSSDVYGLSVLAFRDKKALAELMEDVSVLDDSRITHVTLYRQNHKNWTIAYASGGSGHSAWLRNIAKHIEARGFTIDWNVRNPRWNIAKRGITPGLKGFV